MANGEQGTGNGKQGTGNGKQRTVDGGIRLLFTVYCSRITNYCSPFTDHCPKGAGRALLVATLLASASGLARGADVRESLGPARIGAGFDEVSQIAALTCSGEAARRVCTVSPPEPIVFAGVPAVRIEAVFEDSRLELVKVTFGVKQYANLFRVLTARHGEGEDHSFVAIAGMSGDFVAGVYVWHTAAASLVLEQYAGKIDRSVLTYGSESSMAGLVRKVNAYPRGARRDL